MAERGEHFIFTDYADIFPLHAFPTRLEDQHVSLSRMIGRSLHTMTEVPGYDEQTHFAVSLQGLADGLEASGKITAEQKIQFLNLTNLDEIQDFLWKTFLAADCYVARRAYSWTSGTAELIHIDNPDYQEGLLQQLAERAKEMRDRNLQEIAEMEQRWETKPDVPPYVQEELLELRRENALLEATEFDTTAIINLTNSEPSKTSLQRAMATFDPHDVWSSPYYRLWNLWGRNLEDLLLVAEHLAGQVKFLEIVLESIGPQFRKEVGENLTIAQERLITLRNMTPYDYYNKVVTDPEFPHRMIALPYFSPEQRLAQPVEIGKRPLITKLLKLTGLSSVWLLVTAASGPGWVFVGSLAVVGVGLGLGYALWRTQLQGTTQPQDKPGTKTPSLQLFQRLQTLRMS